jgi:hypothetical protein
MVGLGRMSVRPSNSGSPTEAPHWEARMAHVLTDTLLEDHLRCRTKSYLHLHGRLGEPTAYSVIELALENWTER